MSVRLSMGRVFLVRGGEGGSFFPLSHKKWQAAFGKKCEERQVGRFHAEVEITACVPTKCATRNAMSVPW